MQDLSPPIHQFYEKLFASKSSKIRRYLNVKSFKCFEFDFIKSLDLKSNLIISKLQKMRSDQRIEIHSNSFRFFWILSDQNLASLRSSAGAFSIDFIFYLRVCSIVCLERSQRTMLRSISLSEKTILTKRAALVSREDIPPCLSWCSWEGCANQIESWLDDCDSFEMLFSTDVLLHEQANNWWNEIGIQPIQSSYGADFHQNEEGSHEVLASGWRTVFQIHTELIDLQELPDNKSKSSRRDFSKNRNGVIGEWLTFRFAETSTGNQSNVNAMPEAPTKLVAGLTKSMNRDKGAHLKHSNFSFH
jgi:hypothetical protein